MSTTMTTDPSTGTGLTTNGNGSQSLRWALADSWTIARRNFIHLRRVPEKVVGMVLVPIVTVLLFGYVFGNAISLPGGGDYREFLLPGIFAQTMMFGIVATASTISTDAARGVMDRFRSMPMSRSAVVLGQATVDLVNSKIEIVVMVICGLLIGWTSQGSPGETLGAFGLLLLLRFAFTWVGLYIGLLVRSPDSAALFMPLLLPVTMIANTFVPTQFMPSVLGTVAEWDPLSATVAAIRDLFGNPTATTADVALPLQNPILGAVAWPIVILVIFVPLTLRRFQNLSR
ncbi:MAG: ABC transporter permease [Pseudonocardia sp.]